MGGFVAVVVVLPVVTLGADIGLGVDMAAKMDANPRRKVFDEEREVQSAYGAMPCFQHRALPCRVGRGFNFEANSNQSALLYSQPVAFGRIFE